MFFEAVDKLNSTPRKCLGYKTPYEVFEELISVNIRNLMGYALITRIQVIQSSQLPNENDVTPRYKSIYGAQS